MRWTNASFVARNGGKRPQSMKGNLLIEVFARENVGEGLKYHRHDTMMDAADTKSNYHREAAGAHMVTNIPRATFDTSVDGVIEALRGHLYDCADTVFVTNNDGQFIGIVRINDLFGDGAKRIGDLMREPHEAVRPGDDQEAIAQLAIRLNMIAVPVVDNLGRLLGAVPPEAVFQILRDEHLEDLQRLAGITTHKHGAEAGLDASIMNRFSRRLPWLVFGLLASSLVTLVMIGFEHTLSQNVAAAFFVPALVYIAGAIGAQAVSVSVRSLSTQEIAIGKLLRDEMVIGLGIGAVLGFMAAGAVLAVFGQPALAVAVGLSVLGGGAVSALAGFSLPWAFLRLGFDPALGSGPICTIVQDATSLALYFLLVTALVI